MICFRQIVRRVVDRVKSSDDTDDLLEDYVPEEGDEDEELEEGDEDDDVE